MNSRHAILPALALLCVACTEQAQLGDAANGRVIAERNCQRCHAIGPQGQSPVPEAPTFRSITGKWPPEALAESMAEGMEVGHSGQVDMPNFVFSASEIDDLIAYLKTLEPEK